MASLSETNETKDICNAQWLLMWTTAAYAPQTPTRDEQVALDIFFNKFQDLCHQGSHANCLKHALRDLGRPPVASRRELLLWLCVAENRCLKQAGLPTKRCKYADLMARWRYPDGYL
mmetsp:Transcript_26643/g.62147  ORF Transcript_26643/g.62147 Transcript_26643/m.62147 type:complete len:117 (+) Transcript_26643:53-403(+)